MQGGDGITGDFTHTAALTDDRLLLMIGDVMGSGLLAGEAAGEAKRFVQATVDTAAGADEILAALSQWVESSLSGVLVTAMAAVIDTAASEVTVASAGHPPAVLVRGGLPMFLELEVGPPLGAGSTLRHTMAAWDMPAGSALVMYTDGLVERRDASFDIGLEQLRAALVGVDLPAEELAAHVLEAMHCTDGAGDDIALLTLVQP